MLLVEEFAAQSIENGRAQAQEIKANRVAWIAAASQPLRGQHEGQ